jgi:hypothetical protein
LAVPREAAATMTPTSPPARRLIEPCEATTLPRPTKALLDQLVHLRLIDPAAANAFLAQSRDRLADLADPHLLGEALVQAGHLTDYQLGCALNGMAHTLVLGAYHVLDRLGAGGMGIVLLGEHTFLRRRVAIKLVTVDEGFPPEMLERFYGEMRVLADLRHPHIVLAYDAGQV